MFINLNSSPKNIDELQTNATPNVNFSEMINSTNATPVNEKSFMSQKLNSPAYSMKDSFKRNLNF